MFILGGLGQRWDIQHAPFMQYPRVGGPWSVTRPDKKQVRIAAKQKFLEWVEHKFPEGFEVARIDAERKGLSGLGQRYHYRWSQDMNERMKSFNGLSALGQADDTPAIGPPGGSESKPWYEKSLDVLLDSVNKVVPEYVKFQTDKQLLKLNLSRMKAGLAPAEGEFAMAPAGGGVQDSYGYAEPATPPWLIPAAVGVGLLVLMMPRR